MEVGFTFNELVYVDNVVTSHQKVSIEEAESSLRGLVGSASIVVTQNFILKIGSVILQFIEENPAVSSTEPIPTINIDLEEEEIWLLREIATSSVMVGKEQVGMNLKLKVHAALRELMGKIDLPDSDIKEDKKWKSKLKEWRDTQNASPS